MTLIYCALVFEVVLKMPVSDLTVAICLGCLLELNGLLSI